MKFRSKNLLIITLSLVVLFLVYRNYSCRSSYSMLEIEYKKTDQESSDRLRRLDSLKEELNQVEKELEIAKSEAQLWASRAYKAGYKDNNTIKVFN